MRVLIVDDEPLARKKLRNFLRDQPDVQIDAECGDGRSAVGYVRDRRPDVVFLDILIPELDGFEVVAALEHGERPEIVFVTAYNEYAVRAFEVRAVDYLLKPFNRQRINDTLERVRQQLRMPAARADAQAAAFSVLKELAERRERRFPVKVGSRIILLDLSQVEWLEADGDYVRFHAGKERHLVRATMHEMEARLRACDFVRIHRSAIVNLRHVHSLQPDVGGDYRVLLRSGAELILSRTHRERLANIFADVGLSGDGA